MMNDSMSNPQELTPEDERLLDLLVDGELDDPRRRQLLLTFEEKPSGWRRCALAFLEAQSWGSSFKSMLAERPAELKTAEEPALALAAAASEEAERSSSRAEKPWRVRPVSGLAMAASMLIAFTLGLALRHAYAPSDGTPEGIISSESIGGVPFEFEPTVRNTPDAASENVQLIVDGDGEQHAVEVPLMDDPTLVNSYPFQNESAIPAEVLHQLEEMGHRVEYQRRLAPVELQDGRRLYMPVEDVKIVPVRRQLY